jgi:hypothetical protein
MNQTIDDCSCCSKENTLVFLSTFIKNDAVFLCEKCILNREKSLEEVRNSKLKSLKNFKWEEITD